MTEDNRAKITKARRANLTPKQAAFAAEYVKNKQNGQKAALATYETTDGPTAAVIAHENINKPKVREEIARLLHSNGVELNEIIGLHARNARQDTHLPTSQKAIGDFYEILGMKAGAEKSSGVSIAFIIEK